MPTDKQIEANRRNALLSTGPRTEAGKAASRLNGWKHGLTGHLDALTDEQKSTRDAFIAGFSASLKPDGAAELRLAESIAELHWRLSRVSSLEDNVAQASTCEIDLDLLTLYETRLSRRAQSELRQLLALQKVRQHERLTAERRQKEEAKQKAAEEKQQAARRAKALQEAIWLVNVERERSTTVDPDGVFHHRDGFEFSNRLLLEEIYYQGCLAAAKAFFFREIRHIKTRSRSSPKPLTPKPFTYNPGGPPQEIVGLK